VTEADVLFFTCANGAYHDFAPLYACSVLWTCPSARIEIGVAGEFNFLAAHGAAFDILNEAFGPDRFRITPVDWTTDDHRRIVPNTVRFISQPRSMAKYVYIGDIDFIVLDSSFPKCHLNFMAERGLPYSNSVRPGTKQMSGLHFAEMEAYYPLPDLSDLDLTRANDEEVLYEICRRKGLPIQDEVWFRPDHGIHISPNRDIHGKAEGAAEGLRWGVQHYLENYRRFVASQPMRDLRPYLSARIRGYLDLIEQEFEVTA
jgi:hypothetical protein